MSKYLKWSTSNVSNTDQYGNIWIGNGTGVYGPTSTTGFYVGVNPPVGGYTIYFYSGSTNYPYIYTPSNDTQLVNIYNQVKGTSFSNAPQVEDDIADDDNVYLDGSVVRDGLIMYFDPNKTSSYPGTGTSVTNIAPSATNNGVDATLDAASMWVNPGGGAPAYFRVRSDSTVQRMIFDSTVSRAANGDSTLMFFFWSNYAGDGQYSNSQAFFGGKYTNYMALVGGADGGYGVEAETNGVGTPEGNHDYFARNYGDIFTTGSWSSWTSIFDSGTASNYFDGVLNETTYDFIAPNSSNFTFDRLGSTSTGTGSGDRGGDIRMGALLLYNRVLSAAEIRQNLDIFNAWFS